MRSAAEHAALPVTPEELAKAAVAALDAGADCVHLHVKDAEGVDTLDAERLSDTLRAVREAAPGLPVGVSTGAWMQGEPHRRLRAVERWTDLPDFASVNWHEHGSPDLADLAVARGIGVEAGLWFAEAVDAWTRHPGREAHLRVLLELPDGLGPESTPATADHLLARVREVSEVPVLLHGEGTSTWPALAHARRLGLSARIGFEDTLLLPDGSPALGNDDLVRAARGL